MTQGYIKYKGGYKYQLVEDYKEDVSIMPREDIETDYIDLTINGNLTVKKGYAWDGPSGPTIDTKNFMRGSLVHDALYQLMRNEYIERMKWRAQADLELKRICLEDGMSPIRAWYVHRAVHRAAFLAANPSRRKKISFAGRAAKNRPDELPTDEVRSIRTNLT